MMLNDLRRKCSACIKNDNHLIYNHPAIANKVYKINDQVSIDFSWGYEKTVENFIGTMIVQEELSKHVKIYAMKSKTTAEISEKLIDYLCTFGPCKSIRSDNEPGLIDAINILKGRMA